MTVREIYNFLDTYCPYELAAEWDNPGLNVGRMEAAVGRVLLAMDITDEVIETAQKGGFQLIVTHHPLLFTPIKQVNSETPTGRYILRLAESGIAHIACHTNLDSAEGGVNTCLAAACGIEDAEPFDGLGRMGRAETTFSALIARLKKQLPSKLCIGVRSHEEVRRIAVVGGSGGSMLEEAAKLGCDTFVTGEFKHHHGLLARDLGMNLVMLGHYETEYLALAPLAEALKQRFPALSVELMEQKPPLENL